MRDFRTVYNFYKASRYLSNFARHLLVIMLVPTFELICLATSNSNAVFCFCNLIIVILVVENSKSTSQYNEEKPDPSHSFARENKDFTNMKNDYSSCGKAKKLAEADEAEASSAGITTDEASCVSITKIDYEEICWNEEEYVKNKLRRRVEEFIEKTNTRWRVEML
ncbi:unnamed protein product [Fraxinus pennsylvanica]|uniref:Uncharacterized protein n=1 Tax=Fraxinus pennsylvanica TaxID=56036 RepID=A0AAD2DUU6_9LAMI|nr:unnamed protein product [Fraxinus pennsylvanica]